MNEAPIPPSAEKNRFTRRKFVISALLTAMLSAPLLGGCTPHEEDHGIFETKPGSDLEPGLQEMINQITAIREKFALPGTPKQLKAMEYRAFEDWKDTVPSFNNELPPHILSYGLRIKEIITQLFGKNSTRLVKGAKTDPSFPTGLLFEPTSRSCIIPPSINIPLDDLTGVFLHEACGHGTDPNLKAPYPKEMMIRVTYGKWQALAKMFDVPGQFLNHPGDMMLPNLQRRVGEVVGKFFVESGGGEIVSSLDKEKLEQLITGIATAKGLSVNQLVFNKKVCREIGQELVLLIISKQISIQGDLEETYQEEMESVCHEIYAEMMRLTIENPEAISNDPEIISGIRQVISAIREGSDIDLDKLRQEIDNINHDIIALHIQEKLARTQATDSTESDDQSTDEIRAQQQKVNDTKLKYQDLCENGVITLPDNVGDGLRKHLTEFAGLYQQVIQKYPQLKGENFSELKETFDPNLHIWEIRMIEKAMHTGLIMNFFENQQLTQKFETQIIGRIATLQYFVNSEAFGT